MNKEFAELILNSIATLGYCTQPESPFQKHYITRVFFTIAFITFVITRLKDDVIHLTMNVGNVGLFTVLSFFSGTLGVVLIVKIIVPALGWLLFAFWLLYCVAVVVLRFLVLPRFIRPLFATHTLFIQATNVEHYRLPV